MVQGYRMRGTALLPGGGEQRMPPGAGIWSPSGHVLMTSFDVLLDLNSAPLRLTCIAGLLDE